MEILQRILQGLVNVLIEHHPNMGDIRNQLLESDVKEIPKMGHLPNPVQWRTGDPIRPRSGELYGLSQQCLPKEWGEHGVISPFIPSPVHIQHHHCMIPMECGNSMKFPTKPRIR